MVFRTVDGRVLGTELSTGLSESKAEAIEQVLKGDLGLRVTANARVLAVEKGRPDKKGEVGATFLNGGLGIEGLQVRVPKVMSPPPFTLEGNTLTVTIGETAVANLDIEVANLVKLKFRR